MTAPVCPYTIVLNTSPLEGRTVVVKVREDENLSTLRDHELYFYEEATYRFDTTQSQCEQIGGSIWLSQGCFINNIPCFQPGTTDFAAANRRLDSAGDPTCKEGDVILARGSTDLDVMFEPKDWNSPRRITAVALNDDVDEPTEIRTIHHSVASCVGLNHNSLYPCFPDRAYTPVDVGPNEAGVIIPGVDVASVRRRPPRTAAPRCIAPTASAPASCEYPHARTVPTSALCSCIRTGMHGPTRVVWANLTSFSRRSST